MTSIDSADDASFEIGGILFTIVNWEHDYRDRIGDDRYDSPNYFSWGLLVEGCGRRIFLGADINNYSKGNHESVEQKLVPWIGHVDLFKMCHHGFTGSNCVALMTALSPQIAIHTSRTADFYASCSMVYALGSSMQIYSTYDCNVHGLDAIVVTLSESGLSCNLDGTVTGRVECGYNILFQSGRCVDQTGWIHYGGRHYYCSEINQYGASLFPLGFTTIGGARYSFSENGYALTGWHKIGQTYYFFEADGAGANRMVYYNGTPYYIQDGELKTGWVSYGGHWYYMHSDYTWARNELLELEGDTYGFNDSGQAVANSWLMIGTAYYHFDSQGHLERNTWIFYDGSWYYLGADGAVVTNG